MALGHRPALRRAQLERLLWPWLFLLLLTPPNTWCQSSREQSAALEAIARNQALSAWPSLTPRQLDALQRKAENYLNNYKRYHERDGLTADLVFSNRLGSAIERLEGIGDSATWTGHYLAALAFRYAVTRDTNSFADIHRVLGAYELLTRLTGKDGFIARFAGRADDPFFRPYYQKYGAGPDPNRPGLGTWAYRGAGQYSDWVWLGHPSRDVYLGVNLGLATVYRLVPDRLVRERVQRLVERILACLENDAWTIVDGSGNRSLPPFTPAMIAALLRTGATVNSEKFQRHYEERTGTLLTEAAPRICKYCSYYPNNLSFAVYYLLTTLETDEPKKAHYQAIMRQMWEQASDHLNGYFAALYASATGDVSNLLARATIQGTLIEFPDAPRWDKPTNHSARPDLDIATFDGKAWAVQALPVADRVPSDFLWQRSPCLLTGGSSAALAYPGIDLFLPYWISRECGILSEGSKASTGP